MSGIDLDQKSENKQSWEKLEKKTNQITSYNLVRLDGHDCCPEKGTAVYEKGAAVYGVVKADCWIDYSVVRDEVTTITNRWGSHQ